MARDKVGRLEFSLTVMKKTVTGVGLGNIQVESIVYISLELMWKPRYKFRSH